MLFTTSNAHYTHLIKRTMHLFEQIALFFNCIVLIVRHANRAHLHFSPITCVCVHYDWFIIELLISIAFSIKSAKYFHYYVLFRLKQQYTVECSSHFSIFLISHTAFSTKYHLHITRCTISCSFRVSQIGIFIIIFIFIWFLFAIRRRRCRCYCCRCSLKLTSFRLNSFVYSLWSDQLNIYCKALRITPSSTAAAWMKVNFQW